MVAKLPSMKKSSPKYRASHISSDSHLRRYDLLLKLVGEFSSELLTPEEGFLVLFGRLDIAKRVINRARRRSVADRLRSNSKILDLVTGKGLELPPPPSATLSRLNRSAVYPPLVQPEPPIIGVGMSLPEITAAVRQAKASGIPPHQLLDLVACASGLSWTRSANLLLTQNIIPCPMDPADIGATQDARCFWRLYFSGQVEYAAAAQLGQVPKWAGAWALFSRQVFDCLLGGSILPDHCERAEFLTRYVTAEDPSLYVYGMTGLPLFIHPFPKRFNPLFYGKPPALEIQH
jgi:hypothetical protein